MKPRCTILLPVHNGMPYIMSTVGSLLNQTEKSIVIFALDDGSTDETLQYLQSLKDERLQVFQCGRGGLTSTLNYGIERVTTEYTARMDADDIADSGRIEKQVKFLDMHPDHVLVGGRIRYLSEDGHRKSWDVKVPLSHEEIVKGIFSRRSVMFHPAIMCRTDALKAVNGYDGSAFPAEDYDLYFRLAAIGKLANLPDILIDQRVVRHGIISTGFIASLSRYQQLVEKYSGKKMGYPARVYYYFDTVSALLYRKGLYGYLNQNLAVGYCYFLIASAVNPLRVLRFLYNRFR